MSEQRKLKTFSASTGKGTYHITAEAKFIGDDIIVSIWGGTKPHIGSIVITVPRPSLSNPHIISSTSSTFNFIGHKDEVIARLFSEKIASSFNRNTVSTAGIHIDNLTESDIGKILESAGVLCSNLIKKMEKLH